MPKLRVEFSPRALLDLEDIADFIARDSQRAALLWVDRLVARAKRVGAHPHAGRVVPEISDPAVREVLLKSYRIIYRIERQRVLVLTVLEGHRRLR